MQGPANVVVPPPPRAQVNKAKQQLAWGALIVVVAAAAGYFAGPMLTEENPVGAKIIAGDGVTGPESMVWIPGGDFLMGSDHQLARPNERPTHRVRVKGFWMDRTHVTNAQFAAFVKATGYLTTAERKPDWEALRVQVPEGTPRPPDSQLIAGAMVFVGTDSEVPLNDWSQW